MRNLMLVCAALAVVSAIVSVNLWRELRDERTQSAQLAAKLEELRGGVVSALRQPPAVAHAVAPTANGKAAETPPTAAAEAARQAPANAARPANSFAINERDLMKDPEYRKARIAQTRASMAQNYPDLAEELGLSAEELDKLFTLMASQQTEMMEHSIFIGAGEQPPSEAEMQERSKIMSEINERHQGELAASLGGKYQQFQDYQQSLGARQRVTQLRRTLEGSGMSLSDAQSKPLVAAITAEQRRTSQEMAGLYRDMGPAGPEQQAKLQEENFRRQADSNARLIAAAEPHLDSRQLATFKSMLDSQLAMSRALSRAQRQQQEQAAAQGQPVQQGQRVLIF